jgi:phosphoribosylformylglycinamidine cyclo-ligase
MTEQNKYSLRGASSDKEDVHKAIMGLDKGLYPGAFCKILPDVLSGDVLSAIIMHADGAGTKSALAYMYWMETGSMDVWKGVAQDAMVMNTDDLLCVGVTDGMVCSSTIGRNKHRIPGEVIKALIHGNEEFIQNMRSHGVNIYSSGGETADLGDVVRTVVVDSNFVARIQRDQVIDNKNIAPGQVIVGLSSDGIASYEHQYNSGIGSNGLTGARHDLLARTYLAKYPETVSPETDPGLLYSGHHLLTDVVEGLPLDIGRLILSPTRTYLPVMKAVFDQHRHRIKGIIHCTGGGQTKCLNFVNNKIKIIKDKLPPLPWIFKEIQSASGMSEPDMYKTYNMGIRLEIYTDPQTADDILKIAQQFQVHGHIIGYTEHAEAATLNIHSASGEVLTFHQ